MSEYRLKIKIGEHEFEAEGPTDAVQSQFEAFKNLVANLPEQTRESTHQIDAMIGDKQIPLTLDKIFRAEGRVISLTATPNSEVEAVLLILMGQRHYRSNETATGGEIMDGMNRSGYRLTRIDRLLDGLATDGLIIRMGAHRSTRYRLTNQGLTRAEEIAKELISKVP